MKLKSNAQHRRAIDRVKENISFNFVNLYESDDKEPLASTKWKMGDNKTVNNTQLAPDATKRSRSPNNNTKRKKVNESLNLPGEATGERSSSGKSNSNKPYLTSTPNNKEDKSDNNVKSIMKNKSNTEDSLNVHVRSSKPKKRNKSVSFMLEDTDQVVVKKNKKNDTGTDDRKPLAETKNKDKNKKSDKKEKKLCLQKGKNVNDDKKTSKKDKTKSQHDDGGKTMKDKGIETTPTSNTNEASEVKVKKAKKFKPPVQQTVETIDVNTDESTDSKTKKMKKKKRKAKSQEDTNSQEEGEPANKSRRKDLKPETIAKGLENLNIGDNPHTLSNLLDEMTVVDKNKKKKERQKQRREQVKIGATDQPAQKEITKEESEKVKWENRKWNKGAREANQDKLLKAVVVENLPMEIMCNYKIQLSEHFAKCGTIAGIGVAEVYTNEDSKGVFTTTVYFQDEEGATKALEEDNMMFLGKRIRVWRPLPAPMTTLVVRAYKDMNEQTISSIFSSAGRIRSIRQIVKGKKSISTVFVEFDGPEAVERALKMAEDVKIGGKKVYLAKYEKRNNTSEKVESTK